MKKILKKTKKIFEKTKKTFELFVKIFNYSFSVDEVEQIRRNLILLSNLTDIDSGITVSSDTLLLNKYNKSTLIQAADVLSILLNFSEDKILPKAEYFETKDIPISNEPISISKFTYNINSVLTESHKKIRATVFTDWLCDMGFLKDSVESNFKTITELSSQIGISLEDRSNDNGTKYKVVVYNETAQRYIINQLKNIL